MHSRTFPAPSSLLLLAALLVSGCGMGAPGVGTSASGLTVGGKAMGGQQPVSGAVVQLYAASPLGYGAASIPVAAPALTDAGGSFHITGYVCPSSTTPMYLVSKGGNPGLNGTVNNGAITLMAALGPCGNLQNTSTTVIINEVTTVAAAWALAPFMTAYDHVGSSVSNAVGLSNAFAMLANLASTSSGASPGNAPDGAVIPSAKLNTLANILASCVNTSGGTALDTTPCGNLLRFATPAGALAPLNTADAALNIAQHPGTNVASIFNLVSATGPFQPTLTSAPNDWTVAATFPLNTRTTAGMAFDATGNLWVVSADGLYELSPAGAPLNSIGAMAGNSVAIDPTGNIWVGAASDNLLKMPSTLGAPTTYTAPLPGVSIPGIQGLAIDGNGTPWYTCSNCSSVYKFNPGSGTSTAFVAANVSRATNISVDPGNNIWLGNFNFPGVSVFTNSGVNVSGSPLACGTCGYPAAIANDASGGAWITGYNLSRVSSTGAVTNFEGYPTINGGLFSPSAVAVDGAGSAWITNPTAISSATSGSLTQFSNAGAAVSPSLGYVSDQLATPLSLAVDGSGSVWLRNTGAATVTAFVGAATPVATPLSLGVNTGKVAARP